MTPYVDVPIERLRSHRTASHEPQDFDAFWRDTLAEARVLAMPPTFSATENGLTTIDSFDVRFSGFGGQRIAGWLHRPSGAAESLGCVVQFVGYGSGRGLVHETTLWAQAGYAHFVMDSRGQGASWSAGVSCDPDDGAPAVPGVMTRGIRNPQTYYFRRLMTDAVLAVDAARATPGVDSQRIAVTGGSQGGGLAIAAAALGEGVAAAMVDVPFLCDVARALQLIDQDPYQEIVRYLATHRSAVDQVLATLSYVDAVHLARRATVPALFSVGLMDPVCPPSTVFAAYNAWSGAKEIREYPFNGHEGGAGQHVAEQLRWLPGQLTARA